MLTVEQWDELTNPWVYCCSECGCTDIEGTAWVHLTTQTISNSEPPRDDCWCPECEDSEAGCCHVEVASGRCVFHSYNDSECDYRGRHHLHRYGEEATHAQA